MPKVLIVDDDAELVSVIDSVMKEGGWTSERAYSGGDALQLLRNFKFDLIVLDWNLPDLSGLNVCREFRNFGGETPIIFLTGRHTFPDKELGFNSGADEYITKPFDNRELLLRTQAIMRRPAHLSDQIPAINGVTLDRKGLRVVAAGRTAQLSTTEFAVIEFLFKTAGTFYTGNQLFGPWPSDADATSDVVRVVMKLLRKKLELIGLDDVVKTVRGAGYIVERLQ